MKGDIVTGHASARTIGDREPHARMSPTVLIVPGLRDHVPEHWQTLLEIKLPNARSVPRRDHDKLSCPKWVEALERSLAMIDGPVVLVAHSGGCAIVVHWAQRHYRPIVGALLATPADLESPLPNGYPTTEALRENGWLPLPRAPLPFPTILAASRNDPLCRYERAVELATSWESRVVDLGAVGHLNPAAGFGEWPQAQVLLRELM